MDETTDHIFWESGGGLSPKPHSLDYLNVDHLWNIDFSRSDRTYLWTPRLYPHEKFGGYPPPWVTLYLMLSRARTRWSLSSGKQKREWPAKPRLSTLMCWKIFLKSFWASQLWVMESPIITKSKSPDFASFNFWLCLEGMNFFSFDGTGVIVDNFCWVRDCFFRSWPGWTEFCPYRLNPVLTIRSVIKILIPFILEKIVRGIGLLDS